MAGQKIHAGPHWSKTSKAELSDVVIPLRSAYTSQLVFALGISAQCWYRPPSLITTGFTLLGQNAPTYSTSGSSIPISQTSIWRGGLKAMFSSLLNTSNFFPLYIIFQFPLYCQMH